MSKKQTVLNAPCLSRSGYGTLSDDVFHCLNANDQLDLKVIPVNWGSCVPKTSIRERDKAILDKIPKAPMAELPDLLVTVAIPDIRQDNKPQFKYDINYSCIVEVDKAHDYLIEGLNKYKLSIVPSNFCKDVLLNSDKKPTIPIEVVYWGADTNTFKPDAEPQPNVDAEMSKIKEDEVFVYCGQITHPNLFKDRKDMDTMIKTFCETFKDTPNIALVIKASGTNFSNYDRNALLDRIRILQQMADSKVPVYLMHGELSEKEMAYLYCHKKVIAHISFTHGESFGMPQLEGSLSGKPMFCPNWSAPKEYITNSLFLFDGELQVIPKDVESEFYCKGSKWFYVNIDKAKEKLLHFYNNRTAYNDAAKHLAAKNAKLFNLDVMQTRLNKVINKYVK